MDKPPDVCGSGRGGQIAQHGPSVSRQQSVVWTRVFFLFFVLLALVWCRLARWILATFLDDHCFFFSLSLSQYVHVGGAGERVCRAHEGPVSNGTARCGCRRAHPPIAPCAHLHGAETLGGMQQHSRKESPGLPSSLVGCKCVPNLGRVRGGFFFCCALPCTHPCIARPAQCVFAHPPMCADGLQRILRGRGHARVGGGWE